MSNLQAHNPGLAKRTPPRKAKATQDMASAPKQNPTASHYGARDLVSATDSNVVDSSHQVASSDLKTSLPRSRSFRESPTRPSRGTLGKPGVSTSSKYLPRLSTVPATSNHPISRDSSMNGQGIRSNPYTSQPSLNAGPTHTLNAPVPTPRKGLPNTIHSSMRRSMPMLKSSEHSFEADTEQSSDHGPGSSAPGVEKPLSIPHDSQANHMSTNSRNSHATKNAKFQHSIHRTNTTASLEAFDILYPNFSTHASSSTHSLVFDSSANPLANSNAGMGGANFKGNRHSLGPGMLISPKRSSRPSSPSNLDNNDEIPPVPPLPEEMMTSTSSYHRQPYDKTNFTSSSSKHSKTLESTGSAVPSTRNIMNTQPSIPSHAPQAPQPRIKQRARMSMYTDLNFGQSTKNHPPTPSTSDKQSHEKPPTGSSSSSQNNMNSRSRSSINPISSNKTSSLHHNASKSSPTSSKIANSVTTANSTTTTTSTSRNSNRKSTLIPFSSNFSGVSGLANRHKKSPSMNQISSLTPKDSSQKEQQPTRHTERSASSFFKRSHKTHGAPEKETISRRLSFRPLESKTQNISTPNIVLSQNRKSTIGIPSLQQEASKEPPIPTLASKRPRSLTLANIPTVSSPTFSHNTSLDLSNTSSLVGGSPSVTQPPISKSVAQQTHVINTQQKQQQQSSREKPEPRMSITRSLSAAARRLSRKSMGSLRHSVISRKSSRNSLVSSATPLHGEFGPNSPSSLPPQASRLGGRASISSNTSSIAHTRANNIYSASTSNLPATPASALSVSSSVASSFSTGSASISGSNTAHHSVMMKAMTSNQSTSSSISSSSNTANKTSTASTTITTPSTSSKVTQKALSSDSTNILAEKNEHKPMSKPLPATYISSQLKSPSDESLATKLASNSSSAVSVSTRQKITLGRANTVSIKSTSSLNSKSRVSPKQNNDTNALLPRPLNRPEHFYPPASHKPITSQTGAGDNDSRTNVGKNTSFVANKIPMSKTPFAGGYGGLGEGFDDSGNGNVNDIKVRSKSTVSKQWNPLSNTAGGSAAKRLLLSPFSSDYKKSSHSSNKLVSGPLAADSKIKGFFDKHQANEQTQQGQSGLDKNDKRDTDHHYSRLIRRSSRSELDKQQTHGNSNARQTLEAERMKEIEKIMRSLVRSMPEDEKTTKRYEDAKRNGNIISNPLTPAMASRTHRLNLYEKGEILDFRNVYFCGRSGVKKISGDIRHAVNNYGFDDKNGDYQVIAGDHIAYRYEILGVLGKGSFGKVLKCIDHKNGKLIAVKMVINRKRFHLQALIEADILRSLSQWVCFCYFNLFEYNVLTYYLGSCGQVSCYSLH